MYKKRLMKNFYLFIFILWYSTEILFNTTLKTNIGFPLDILNTIVNWLIFALLMMQIVFFQAYKKRELFIIIAITLPIIISTILSGSRIMLSAWMFIVAAKNTNSDKVVSTVYKILLVMIPIIVALCVLGFLPDYIIMRGNIKRYSFGFIHPNIFGAIFFQLIMCHSYINRDKLNVFNYCLIIFSAFLVIKIPNSKTPYICFLILLLLLLIYAYIKRQRQIFVQIYMNGLFIGSLLLNIFSIAFSFMDVSRNSVLKQIDKWLSLRFSFCHKVWLLFGVSFLGQRVYITDDERELVGIKSILFLDNAYVSILLRYGVVVFLIFSVGYLYLMKYMIVKKEYVLVIILFLYSLYGIMGPGIYMLVRNVFLIAFADLLYDKKKGDETAQNFEIT